MPQPGDVILVLVAWVLLSVAATGAWSVWRSIERRHVATSTADDRQRQQLLAYLGAERRLSAVCTRHACILAGRCDH